MDYGVGIAGDGVGLGSSAWAPIFQILGAVSLPLILGLAAWALLPYLDWRSSADKPLESHIARTSFQSAPGELVPSAWKEPEVNLSIIVPAYNEEYRLPQMLDETLSYLEARAAASHGRFSYEVIVVDDGSSDATYEAALGASRRPASSTTGSGAGGAAANGGGALGGAPVANGGGAGSLKGGEVRVVRLAANRGKGFAVRVGMLVARGQLLLMADADGATSIRDLDRLEKALGPSEDAGPTIAFGSRHHLKDEALAKRAWYRNVLMEGFHVVVWLLVGGSIRDTQCGFKLFRAKVGKQIFSSLHIYRWAFDIEVLLLARFFGQTIAEIPVTWVEMPGSKLNLVTGALTMLRDIVVVQALYAFGIWRPVR